jgi:hypothetical protein
LRSLCLWPQKQRLQTGISEWRSKIDRRRQRLQTAAGDNGLAQALSNCHMRRSREMTQVARTEL